MNNFGSFSSFGRKAFVYIEKLNDLCYNNEVRNHCDHFVQISPLIMPVIKEFGKAFVIYIGAVVVQAFKNIVAKAL